MSEFEKAFEEVCKNVKIFRSNEAFYTSAAFDEAAARKDFIDKFFFALGWDVGHDIQHNPYAQEVKVERTAGDTKGRADYAFYLAPNYRDVRFYAEAKKPHGEIATAGNYFQTLRYGSGGRTPLAALTSFEYFHVLDCRFKADIKTALERRVKSFHYLEYLDREKFAEIYWLFSHEAVAQGALEKFAATLPKRGKGIPPPHLQKIDDAFLDDLEGYRATLAHAFKKKNPSRGSEQLTEAIQRVLDRLVFMRFLEDKLIEPQKMVARFGASASAWEDFVADSRRLDGIYNGIVFKQHDIDAPNFRADEEAFAAICRSLSDEHSPYDFDAIPIHILGSIYERFLGKVIAATGKRVRVLDKPEVRKAGGVYYTPEYIVRYIVENTVGKLIAGKTPGQIAGMRFADIACGSGSFLLGVYDLLLEYHGSYYNQHTAEARPGDCVERDDKKLFLSLQKKREILLNNIYGVDIDHQAVEVAQLSLYLKLLQEETEASTQLYRMEFAHNTRMKKLLPDLGKNIVCGNSLIGTDILKGQLFENGEERKLNPMDFEDAFPFPEVKKRGWFDAIVGNPPYVRIQGFPREQVEYLTRRYRSATGNCDLYVSFVERGYSRLKPDGRLGYIVPNKFFRTDYGVGLRELAGAEKAVTEIVDFGASQVFEATTYTCLLFLSKHEQETMRYAQVAANQEALTAARFRVIPAASLTKEPWFFANEAAESLIQRIARRTKRLLDLPVKMSRGSSTGDDAVFVVAANAKIEKECLRIPVFATDFSRYFFTKHSKWRVVFPYEVKGDTARLLSENDFQRRFPKAYAHLKIRQVALKKRKQYTQWFGFSAPRNLSLHNRAQIAVPLLAQHGQFALLPEALRGKLCPMASGGFTITLMPDCPFRPEYLIGLINSRLLFWRLQQMSNLFRGGWITCTKQYFGELPLVIADKPQHDEMVAKVEAMLEAKKDLAKAQTEKDRTYYEKKCAAFDRQIDRLVFELYGLTEDEIQIVEESANKNQK